MSGLLLDTHVFLWFAQGAPLDAEALRLIIVAQQSGNLLVSSISAWELAVAARKPAHKHPPDLGGQAPEEWFRGAADKAGARLVGIHRRVAFETAAVAAITEHGDPADCFVMATARVSRVPLVTRDHVILRIARDRPGYLQVVRC